MSGTIDNKKLSDAIQVGDYIKLVSGCIMVVGDLRWADRWWLSTGGRTKELVIDGAILSREGIFSRRASCYGEAYKRHATIAETVTFKLTVGCI